MIYRRQFAVLKYAAQIPGLERIDLWDGWILHAHKALPVFCDAEKHLLLLGIAWQTQPGLESPEAQLSALERGADGRYSREAILRMEENWCGRYVLIADQEVFLDANGLLGVFISAEGIASQLALMAEILGLEQKRYTARPGARMNWLPAPLTPYPQIRRCLPSQTYDLESGEVRSRPLLVPLSLPSDSPDVLTEEFLRVSDASLRNMAQKLSDCALLLALTGGYDSRALFAMLKHAGLSFRAFNLWHDHFSAADSALPAQVAESGEVPFEQGARDLSKKNDELEQAYLAFTSGLMLDEDRLFYAYGQYQSLIAQHGRSALIRGGIWANAVESYGSAFQADGPNDVFYEWFGIPRSSLEADSLAEYFRWTEEHPEAGICPADRFYWEQRCGGWLSAIETGFDMLEDTLSFHPMNSRYLLSILLRYPREERLSKAHEARIARAACPAIAGVPYKVEAGKKSRVAFYLQKGRMAVKRLRQYGLKRTILIYKNIFHHNKEKNQ